MIFSLLVVFVVLFFRMLCDVIFVVKVVFGKLVCGLGGVGNFVYFVGELFKLWLWLILFMCFIRVVVRYVLM